MTSSTSAKRDGRSNSRGCPLKTSLLATSSRAFRSPRTKESPRTARSESSGTSSAARSSTWSRLILAERDRLGRRPVDLEPIQPRPRNLWVTSLASDLDAQEKRSHDVTYIGGERIHSPYSARSAYRPTTTPTMGPRVRDAQPRVSDARSRAWSAGKTRTMSHSLPVQRTQTTGCCPRTWSPADRPKIHPLSSLR